jgi:hypothetical protein
VALEMRRVEHRTLMACARRLRAAAQKIKTNADTEEPSTAAAVLLVCAKEFERDAKKLEKR